MKLLLATNPAMFWDDAYDGALSNTIRPGRTLCEPIAEEAVIGSQHDVDTLAASALEEAQQLAVIDSPLLEPVRGVEHQYRPRLLGH